MTGTSAGLRPCPSRTRSPRHMSSPCAGTSPRSRSRPRRRRTSTASRRRWRGRGRRRGAARAAEETGYGRRRTRRSRTSSHPVRVRGLPRPADGRRDRARPIPSRRHDRRARRRRRRPGRRYEPDLDHPVQGAARGRARNAIVLAPHPAPSAHRRGRAGDGGGRARRRRAGRPDPVDVRRLGRRHGRADAPRPHRPRARHGLARDGARRVLVREADLRRRPGQLAAYVHRSVRDAGEAVRGSSPRTTAARRAPRSSRSSSTARSRRRCGGDGVARARSSSDASRTASRSCSSRGRSRPVERRGVSQSPTIAHMAGFPCPPARVLPCAPAASATSSRSRELLGPVLKFFEVDEGIATAVAQLRFGGDGNTAVHAGDESVIRASPRPRPPTGSSSTRRRCSARWAIRPASTELHARHAHDRRLDLVRQHRRAAPDQPQARRRAAPRLARLRHRRKGFASPTGRSTAMPIAAPRTGRPSAPARRHRHRRGGPPPRREGALAAGDRAGCAMRDGGQALGMVETRGYVAAVGRPTPRSRPPRRARGIQRVSGDVHARRARRRPRRTRGQ